MEEGLRNRLESSGCILLGTASKEHKLLVGDFAQEFKADLLDLWPDQGLFGPAIETGRGKRDNQLCSFIAAN